MLYSKEAESRYIGNYKWNENPLVGMYDHTIYRLFSSQMTLRNQPRSFDHFSPFEHPIDSWWEYSDHNHNVDAKSAFMHLDLFSKYYSLEKKTNYIANIVKGMKTRPLTLLIHGSSHGHTMSFIARISADNKCELLIVNSMIHEDEHEQDFIGIIKNGVKQALNLSDDDFTTVKRVAKQQQNFSCIAITAAVLAHVDPDQTLAQQRDQLAVTLSAAIEHSEELRKLIARIEWWHCTIGYRREFVQEQQAWVTLSEATQQEKQTMKLLFMQLFDGMLGIQPKTKVDIPEDHIEMCAKFLYLFDIKVNDAKFASLFQPVDAVLATKLLAQYPQPTISKLTTTEAPKNSDYFKYKHWKTHRNALLDKLGNNDKKVKHALDSLARHSRAHLSSPYRTTRAKAGHLKHQQLYDLLNNATSRDELQQNLQAILDIPAKQSDLLKNRGGFFGAYKKFSKIADKTGRKHFKYNDQYAVSSTHQRLIALYDSVSTSSLSQ